MIRARKPLPRTHTLAGTALSALPRCPAHLDEVARKEWRRLATPLHEAGIFTLAGRTALAAYCQAYARWVEAEERLRQTPALVRTPNGHVQQSPWLTVANKQMELMGRYMTELGLTPVAQTRVDMPFAAQGDRVEKVKVVIVGVDDDGNRFERPLHGGARTPKTNDNADPVVITVNKNL